MTDTALTFGSLFSGIGGFDLGFGQAGMQCLWQVENDAKASTVLARHWPDVERFEDVRNVGRDNLRPVDVICGGFPCQDVSVAGNRAGLAGERSGLWFEFHRILDELRPVWVVIENVPGLLSSNGGRDFATILCGMVELRYGVSWRVLDSQYFGVAQRRRRVFIVGHLGGGRSAKVLFEPTSVSRRPSARREKRQGASRNVAPSIVSNGDAGSGFRDEKGLVIGSLQAVDSQYVNSNKLVAFDRQHISEYGSGDVASTVSARDFKDATDLVVFQQNQRDDNSDSGLGAAMQIYSASGPRRLTPTECERLQAFPDGWTDGQSDNARYKQLGNAVTVSVARWIGNRIMQLRKETEDVQLA